MIYIIIQIDLAFHIVQKHMDLSLKNNSVLVLNVEKLYIQKQQQYYVVVHF